MRKSLLVLMLAALAAFTFSAFTGSAAASVTVGDLAQTETGPGGCQLCNFLQVGSDSAGPSYVVPSAGIITSFSIQTGTVVRANSWVKFRLLHHVFGDSYAIDAETAQVTIPPTAAASTLQYPTRIAASADQLLGLAINSGTPGGNTTPFKYTSSTSDLIGSLPQDTNLNEAANLTGAPGQQRELNIRAVLEADADKDGYGDETQDCYSNDPNSHVYPCPDTTAPVISKLMTKNAKFRVNKKGALIATSTAKGTTFSFTSSEVATISYTVSKVGKKKKLKSVHGFSRSAVAGLNKLVYSGRYRDAKHKKKWLSPGSYRLQAVETDAAGNRSIARSVSFKVVA